MEITLDAARREKNLDTRLMDRERSIGLGGEPAVAKHMESLEDCTSLASWVNTDDLNANDNPVHVGRNLPVYENRKPQPFEELEFEEQASKLHFEH